MNGNDGRYDFLKHDTVTKTAITHNPNRFEVEEMNANDAYMVHALGPDTLLVHRNPTNAVQKDAFMKSFLSPPPKSSENINSISRHPPRCSLTTIVVIGLIVFGACFFAFIQINSTLGVIGDDIVFCRKNVNSMDARERTYYYEICPPYQTMLEKTPLEIWTVQKVNAVSGLGIGSLSFLFNNIWGLAALLFSIAALLAILSHIFGNLFGMFWFLRPIPSNNIYAYDKSQ